MDQSDKKRNPVQHTNRIKLQVKVSMCLSTMPWRRTREWRYNSRHS